MSDLGKDRNGATEDTEDTEIDGSSREWIE